nr:hypothetical protein Iba_chr05cCG11670 [Ipomoea batatas]
MKFTNSRRKHRGICRVEQPPEHGIIDAVREWVSTWTTQVFCCYWSSPLGIAKALPPLSNCYKEPREVCRVEQPPEHGIIDAVREWVSTRTRRISVVDGVSHRTAQPLTANAASSSTTPCRFQSLEPVGAFCRWSCLSSVGGSLPLKPSAATVDCIARNSLKALVGASNLHHRHQ